MWHCSNHKGKPRFLLNGGNINATFYWCFPRWNSGYISLPNWKLPQRGLQSVFWGAVSHLLLPLLNNDFLNISEWDIKAGLYCMCMYEKPDSLGRKMPLLSEKRCLYYFLCEYVVCRGWGWSHRLHCYY